MAKAFLIFALISLTGCGGYKVEDGRWALIRYNEGVGRMVTVVGGADQSSFRPINSTYAKDKHSVYWGTNVIENADPKTFIYLGKLYGKDSKNVYWREREIVGAEPDSFQIVDGSELWSRDKRDYYFAARRLGIVDLNSFTRVNRGWARDKFAYYATPQFAKQGKVDCDYPTMRVLDPYYAKDKSRAYYQGMPIEGVDVESFRVTGQGAARDRYRKYRGDKVDWLK